MGFRVWGMGYGVWGMGYGVRDLRSRVVWGPFGRRRRASQSERSPPPSKSYTGRPAYDLDCLPHQGGGISRPTVAFGLRFLRRAQAGVAVRATSPTCLKGLGFRVWGMGYGVWGSRPTVACGLRFLRRAQAGVAVRAITPTVQVVHRHAGVRPGLPPPSRGRHFATYGRVWS